MADIPGGAANTADAVGGRFVLLEVLGSGGMGTVWRARDETLGREVAVKELKLPPGLDAQARAQACARAVREAQASARLQHPGIVVVHDALTHDGLPWIVMQLLRGQSLDAALEAGPLSPRRTAELGLQILDALAVAHAAGILHRDIKPGNIFLTVDGSDAGPGAKAGDRPDDVRTGGRAILTDFGIASIEGQATITQSGMFVGSPGHIAPERLRGEAAGPQSDLWSLAATLYRTVEGVPPHHAGTHLGVLASVLTEPPRPPELARAMGPLLLAMLAKDPQSRPEPGVVRQVLEQLATGAQNVTVISPPQDDLATAPARTVTPPYRPPLPPVPPPTAPPSAPAPAPRLRPSRRNTALVSAAALAVLASFGGATYVVMKGRPAEPATVVAKSPGAAQSQSPAQSPGAGGSSPLATAKFSDPFDPCTLVPMTQVRQIIPKYTRPAGVVGGEASTPSCEWNAPGAGATVTLGLGGSGWPDNVADAHDSFVARQRHDAVSDKIIWHYPGIGGEKITSGMQTPAQTVTGVGEEAFVTDTPGRLGAQVSTVWFRVSNLVVRVEVADVSGTTTGVAIRERAVRLARWTAAALEKRP